MKFEYVEMVYEIGNAKSMTDELPDIGIINIADIDEAEREKMYHNCFENGDAVFYKLQDNDEKARYYKEELGLPDVLKQPESHAISKNGEFIGYLYAMQFGKENVHISCMCVNTGYQGQGYGRKMLEIAENISRKRGMKTLSLGTETKMKAYYLYRNYGFKETEFHIVEL